MGSGYDRLRQWSSRGGRNTEYRAASSLPEGEGGFWHRRVGANRAV